MRRLIIPWVLCLLLAAPWALAEEEALFAWTVQIGGEGLTSPLAMVTASTGGIFVVGTVTEESSEFSDGFGGIDGFVLRLDENGGTRWQRRLGGSADDVLTAVMETPDGGCLAFGTTLSADGDARASRGGMDAWMVRLDETGETIFSKCLGGSLDDELHVVLQTEEGHFFACGRTQSRNGDLGANMGGWDAWATLLNAEDGKPLWTYRYGDNGNDAFYHAVHALNGWVLLGEMEEQVSTDANGNPVYITRPMVQYLSSEGEPLWEAPLTLGETGQNILGDIVETDTGWVLAGETNSRSALMSTHGGKDIWILSIRTNGIVSLQRTFGGSRDEKLHSIRSMPGGGYILLATTESGDGQVFGSHGEQDVWLVRITAGLLMEWQQPIGGSEDSEPAGLLLLEDGGFLVAGTTASQDGDIGRHISVRTGFLAWLAPNGNLQKTALMPMTEECTLLSLDAQDGVAYVLGVVRDLDVNGAIESLWVARLATEGYVAE